MRSVGMRSVGMNSYAVGRGRLPSAFADEDEDKKMVFLFCSFSTKVETRRFAPQRRTSVPPSFLHHNTLPPYHCPALGHFP